MSKMIFYCGLTSNQRCSRPSSLCAPWYRRATIRVHTTFSTSLVRWESEIPLVWCLRKFLSTHTDRSKFGNLGGLESSLTCQNLPQWGDRRCLANLKFGLFPAAIPQHLPIRCMHMGKQRRYGPLFQSPIAHMTVCRETFLKS